MSASAGQTLPHSALNAFGDLVCPACGTTILTPGGMVLQQGTGSCPRCATRFALSGKQAAAANRRAEAFRARVALEFVRV